MENKSMYYPNATESIRDLIYFTTTARAQSITAAANELGMSKSAIGKSIQRLEEQLGTALFHRNTRRITLTTEGALYLKSCVNALNILSDAERELMANKESPSGTIRVDMPSAFGRSIVMPILLDIGERFPEIKFILTFDDRVNDPMEEGFDLAFRFGALPESSDLVARGLNEQQLVLCASPSYLEKYGYPKNINELYDHRCLVAWRLGKPLNWLFRDDKGNDMKFLAAAHHQISDGDAMVAASVSGAGIIQFPHSLVKNEIENNRLVILLPQFNPKPSSLNIIWPKTKYFMPGMRYVIDEFLRLADENQFN